MSILAIRPLPTLLGALVALLVVCCDGGPDEPYCEPCVGEIPAECLDICVPDDSPEGVDHD